MNGFTYATMSRIIASYRYLQFDHILELTALLSLIFENVNDVHCVLIRLVKYFNSTDSFDIV